MAEVSFGEWLKRRRSGLGLTQEQLARQLNCSTSALRKMEAELRRPSASTVEQLAKIFNIPQEEQKSFLQFARGDWRAISDGEHEEAPWHVTPPSVDTQTRAVFPKNNLPLQLSSFVGREKEQEEIVNLVKTNRLATLVGLGGIGKTRLSIQSASALLSDFPNGTWLVELAPLSEPDLVPQAIVNTLGLLEQAGRSHLTVLTDFFQDKRALLILDNCEHLIQSCAQLAKDLLSACPDLHILATSREALSITGEVVYLVPTLTTPDLTATFEAISQSEAVHLFLERARLVQPDFSLNQENAYAIAQICHYLDGIPLAIELAAARARLLRVEEIETRLAEQDRFHLLTGGTRTALPRHQTLQAMIDWSHDLLSEPERALLRRLSIFAGGWTLEAAEYVANGEEAAPFEVLDLLTSLLNKSLIIMENKSGQEIRHTMLETIRQYASEKLWQAGEAESVRRRHAAYYVNLAERAEPNLRAHDMVVWLDRLEAEHENIRSVLEWALEGDIEAELRLGSALLWFWHIRGHKNEGLEWLERGLSIEAMDHEDQPRTPDRAKIRGKALNASGSLMVMNQELERASSRLEESLSLFKELGPGGKQGMAYALLRLASLPSRPDRVNMLHQTLTWFREIGDKFGVAENLIQLSGVIQNDDYQQAMLFSEEQLALSRETGDRDGVAAALSSLADLAVSRDDYQRAIPLYEESLAMFRTVKNRGGVSLTLGSFGDVFFWQGNYQQATKTYEEALDFVQELGYRFHIAFYFYSLGILAWFRGEYLQATRQVSSSHPIFRSIGHHWLTVSSLHTLGDIALAEGDVEKASQWYQDELKFSQEFRLEPPHIFAKEGLAKVAWVKGEYELAVKRSEESLRLSQNAGIGQATFQSLLNLGRVARSQGDYDKAHAFYIETLKLQKRRISPLFNWVWLKTYVTTVSYPLEGLGILAAAQNQMGRAARLLGAAEHFYTPIRLEMSARERTEHDRAIAAARAALGEPAFSAAYAEGKKMTLDQAANYGLEKD